MALTLDATVSGATSNSYCTQASCSPFLEPQIKIWGTFSSLSTADQEASLIQATSLLDTLVSWVGTKETDKQALRWPRTSAVDVDGYAIDDDTHPIWLQRATANFAWFLSQSNRTEDSDTFGFKSLKAGSLAMVIDKYDRIPTMPSIVWAIVKPYGTKMDSIPRTLERK